MLNTWILLLHIIGISGLNLLAVYGNAQNATANDVFMLQLVGQADILVNFLYRFGHSQHLIHGMALFF